jgi:hypothetical protein
MGRAAIRRRGVLRWGVTAAAMVTVLAGCLPGADITDKSGPGAGPQSGAADLTGVRVGRHDEEGGFDRVVFEFANHVAPWTVGYVPKPITEDPSGQDLPVAGFWVLQVRLFPADGSGYTGSRRIAADTTQVAELVQRGDFEAVLSWVIGTRSQVPFRVSTLLDPPRLVIDVSHT